MSKNAQDFVGLEKIKDDEIREAVREARITARDICDILDPQHITSWSDLLNKLERCINKAKFDAIMFDPERFRDFLKSKNE